MLSLCVDSLKIVRLSLAFKNKCGIFGFGFFVVSFGINSHNSNLLFGIDVEFLSCGFSIISQSNSLGFNLVYNNSLLTFSLCDQDGSIFLSVNNCRSFFSMSLNFILLLISGSSLNFLWELIHFSLVNSLKICQFLSFFIFKSKLFVLLIFQMIFVSKLNFGLFRKSIFQLLVDDNIGNIALLEDNTILRKFMVQLIHHSVSHIRFKIKNIYKPYTLDEISDIFFDFGCKEFIKSSCSKLVNESFNLLLILWKSESEMNIYINISIIFGWASLNWCIIVNNILGKHTSDSLVAAVAPVGTSLHDTGWGSAVLLKHYKVCWNIKLNIKAAASIGSFNHNNNALLVWMSFTWHLVSCIFKTGGRNLNDSGSLG